jgi:hypothetical protein
MLPAYSTYMPTSSKGRSLIPRPVLYLMTVPATGVFCLGVFVACLAWFFVVRFRSYGAVALSGTVAVVLGAVIVAFIEADEAGRGARWWYPIGLLTGSVLFAIVHRLQPPRPP